MATRGCPCGWRGHPRKACICPPHAVAAYLGRLSGPLIDRLDLQIELPPVAFEDWAEKAPRGESTETVRARVAAARERQAARWGKGPAALNAFVPDSEFRRRARVTPAAMETLAGVEKLSPLSARALDRILRVARTAADLAGRADVRAEHVHEAARLRGLDRLRAALETA